MQKHRRFLFMIFILFIAISISANAYCAEPIKIKGFFIGMNIDDALKNFERLGFKGLKISETIFKKNTRKYYTISPERNPQFEIKTGVDVKTVSKIYFSSRISDRLFNTKGIDAIIFKDFFKEAYGIFAIVPYKDNPGTDSIKGWDAHFTEDGYRIRIFLNKDIEIIKTARVSEFSFD
jgi:hypothetical protein